VEGIYIVRKIEGLSKTRIRG